MNRDSFKVKICGVTSLEDARFIAGLRADFIGFIFHEESPRYISPEKAGAIIHWLHGPRPVGVYVNHPVDALNSSAKQSGVEFVQLHGTETPEYCSLVEKPVIKVFHIDPETKPDSLDERIAPYLDVAAYLMFDTKMPDKWGGSGQTFDWNLLKTLNMKQTPFFLSGGLSHNNIGHALQNVHPFAIDLSSSIESEPGKKDFDKIEELFQVIRQLKSGPDGPEN